MVYRSLIETERDSLKPFEPKIMTTTPEPQLASTVLMIRPVRFESNPHTAASNRFQGKMELSAGDQQDAALREFDDLTCVWQIFAGVHERQDAAALDGAADEEQG